MLSDKEAKAKESPVKDALDTMKKVCSALQFLTDLIDFVKDTLLTLKDTFLEVKNNPGIQSVKKLVDTLNDIVQFLKKVGKLFSDEEEDTEDLEEQRLEVISEFLEKIGSNFEQFEAKVEAKIRELTVGQDDNIILSTK